MEVHVLIFQKEEKKTNSFHEKKNVEPLLTPTPRRGEGGILFYVRSSVPDIFRRIFLSNC